MSDLLLVPEGFHIHIPVHAADLGRWLRKNGIKEDIIEIFMGKTDSIVHFWRARDDKTSVASLLTFIVFFLSLACSYHDT